MTHSAAGPAACLNSLAWTGNCEYDRIEELRASIAASSVGSDITIDISDVKKVDASLLGLLIEIEHKARPGRLRLVGANARLHAIFMITGLHKYFSVESLNAA
ncbi:MAG: STAS domain-containing protein [Candidatus Eremiobacteraeota bacterium]|nr:STAS domain-containing protein [Candidatus Eremiobacteraeota bacterium]